MPKKVVLSFFQISKKRYNQLTKKEKKRIFDAHPVFDQNDPMYFSMIDKIKKDDCPVFKAGGHQLRSNVSDLDRVWQLQLRAKDRKWAKKHFRKYLEILGIPLRKKDIEYISGYTCVYSVSPTKVPFVTNIFTKEDTVDQGIVVVGGMSGTGAKGCLAYGQLAADLLLQTEDSDKMYQRTKKTLGRPLWKPKGRRKRFI